MTKKRVHRAILQSQQMIGLEDQLPQHLTTQAGGPPQVPPATNMNTNHQDPPECNHTNGSTKAPTNGKGPGATKAKKALTNADPATQPSNTIICSQCGESGHWSKNCPHHNFCDFCRVTTHATHMCRATKHGPGSPVCIYCSKSNHSSANCRYRPKDNQEEPQQTTRCFKNWCYWQKFSIGIQKSNWTPP